MLSISNASNISKYGLNPILKKVIDIYLMEHDEYGNEAASIIVDATGKLVAEDLWEGFTPEIVEMIVQEQGCKQLL